MSSLELRAYEIFKSKLGEAEAATLIEYFESKADEKINQKKDIFLVKEDKIDIIKWMVGMWVAQMAAIVFMIIKK